MKSQADLFSDKARRLGERLANAPKEVVRTEGLNLRQAVVSTYATGGLATIALGGSTTTVANVRSLIDLLPNDVVWVLQNGPDLLIVGYVDAGYIEVGSGGSAPAFTNSWVNYGGAEAVARFRKIMGITYIEGEIKNGTLGAAAFTLPVGYRPGQKLLFATDANGAVHGQLIVNSDGTVVPNNPNNLSFSLNVSFLARG